MRLVINNVLFQACCLLGSSAMLVEGEETRNDVQLLLFETDSIAQQINPRSPLHFINKRREIANLKATVYGNGLPFQGFGTKYQTLLPLLEMANPETLIVLADARDTVLNIPDDENVANDIVDYFVESYKILTENTPNAVVVSAEAQCCVSALSHAHPSEYFDPETGKRKKRACSSGSEDCRWFENDNIHSWVGFMQQRAFNATGHQQKIDSYLNAGLMAGYPKDLINLIDLMDIYPTEDDQAVLSGLMYTFPDMVVLDYDQEMFGNNQWTKGINGCVFEGDGSKSGLTHLSTKTQPLMIHAPGKFYSCLDIIMEALGGESQQRYHPSQRKLIELSGRMKLAQQLGLGGALRRSRDNSNKSNNENEGEEGEVETESRAETSNNYLVGLYGTYGQYGGNYGANYGANNYQFLSNYEVFGRNDNYSGGAYGNSNYAMNYISGDTYGIFGQYGVSKQYGYGVSEVTGQYGNYGNAEQVSKNYGYRRLQSRTLRRQR